MHSVTKILALSGCNGVIVVLNFLKDNIPRYIITTSMIKQYNANSLMICKPKLSYRIWLFIQMIIKNTVLEIGAKFLILSYNLQ